MSMLARQDVQYIQVSDFTPGCWSLNYPSAFGVSAINSGDQSAPQGAADPGNTYRCFAQSDGSLRGLPQSNTLFHRTNLGGGVSNYFSGMKTVGPVLRSTDYVGANPFIDINQVFGAITFPWPIDVFLGVTFQDAFQQGRFELYRPYVGQTGPTGVGDNQTVFLVDAPLINHATANNGFMPAYSDFGRSAVGPTLKTFVAGAWQSGSRASTDTTKFYGGIYPDPAGTVPLPFGHGDPLFCHQGRVVELTRFVSADVAASGGALSEVYFYTTTLAYTDAGVNTVSGGTLNLLDAPYGYGAWGSQSSSDLLLVAHKGGGVVIQGDLDNPIVRLMPGVIPTHGVESVGANTPLGFVYMSNGVGVCLWDGGPTSKCISPQLDPGVFHDFHANPYGRFRGAFAYWNRFIACPQSWVFDIETGGWWKLEVPYTNNDSLTYDQVDLLGYDVDPVYGALLAYKTANAPSDTANIIFFDPAIVAATWRWQSHPYKPSEVNTIQIRELTVSYSATDGTTGAITPSIIMDSATVIPLTLQPTSGGDPTTSLLRWNIPEAAQGRTCAVRFDVNNSAGSTVSIKGFQLGYFEIAPKATV